MEKRRSGILQPVSSLPGTLGIGDFGKTAYEWVDALAEAKVSLWQILPLNPVGYGNSLSTLFILQVMKFIFQLKISMRI